MNLKKEDFFNHKKQIVSGLAGVLTLLLLVLAVSTGVDIYNKIKASRYIGQDVQYKNTIVVSESGEVFAKPDLALLNLTVVNEKKTVTEATAENTQRMNEVIEEMKALGIDQKDLKTASYNIYPRYEYDESEISSYRPGKRVLVGYEVSQSLQVKIRDMEKVGQVIEKATEAGANEVGSLSFVIDNEDSLKKQAREMAIKKAKDKANGMAEAVGIKLGKIVNFSESYYAPYYDARDYVKTEAVGMGGAPAPDIQPGENKITANVTITYEIR